MADNLSKRILQRALIDGSLNRGAECGIKVDQVYLNDNSGTQTLLHFEAMGLDRVLCRLAVCYADHNVLQARPENMTDHIYLQTACKKYGIWFGKPGCGIGHQVHLEHFAVPGMTMLGADSHTPHCGGVGMLAMGAGGLDVAVVMAGGAYYLTVPEIVNVFLTGQLQPWCTAKDVALHLLRGLTFGGGTGKILEFTGPGIKTLNVQQRTTLTNMCTEIGATTGIFPSDEVTRDFYQRIGRERDWQEVTPDPGAEYDDVIELNLSAMVPLIALPSLPDKVVPVRDVEGTKVEQVMVGSCTNGSYSDLKSVATIMRGQRVHEDVTFFVHPSSSAAFELLAKEGALRDLVGAGVELASPSCGACIGIGHVPAPGTKSLRAINRNFKGRSGQKEDAVYLCSPETAAATAIKGQITDPRDLGADFAIRPQIAVLPREIKQDNPHLVPPAPRKKAGHLRVRRGENIVPAPVKGPIADPLEGEVLLKVGDNVTTDHILPAGIDIVAYRSNIPRISEYVFHQVDPEFSGRAKEKDGGWIVAGANYGQGSSREHAALSPMFLGVKGILAKSFARIHHTNLINFGLLPLIFHNPHDYDEIKEGDFLTLDNVRDSISKGALVVTNRSKGMNYQMCIGLTGRQVDILSAGGLMAYTRRVGKPT